MKKRKDGNLLIDRASEFVEKSKIPSHLKKSFYKLLRDYCDHGSSSTEDLRDEFYQDLKSRLGF